MRPLEVVLLIGAAALVIGWAAGWRSGRILPAGLLAVAILQVAVEGQRVAMWPVYAIVAIAAVAALLRSGPRAPAGRGWRAVGRWAVALPVALIAIAFPILWPVMRLPAPSGRYAVGQTFLTVTDSTREERFFGGQAGARRFPVKIWYPAPAGTRGAMAPYAQSGELGGGAFAMPAWLFSHLGLIRTHALVDPAPASGDRFPVLVFSHGYGGNFSQNTVQMEELASRGYLVASIAHPGEASWAPFPDGTGLPMDSALLANLKAMAADTSMNAVMATMAAFDTASTAGVRLALFRRFLEGTAEPLRSESVTEWSADTRALVDRLTELDRGPSPFQGRLDLDRLGVFGMSYGGATAGEFCRLDRRCKAAVNIDGGQYGGLVDDSLLVPLMIIASTQAYSVHVPVLDLVRAPAYLVKVPETTHMGLTDLTLMAPTLFRMTGLIGDLDPDRRQRIMTDYLAAFFDLYLRGQPSPLLAEGSTAFPDVTLVRRNVP